MVLKHRDRDLLRFEWMSDGGVRIVSIEERARRFLPLAFGAEARAGDARSLEPVLGDWLRRRTAPIGRHFMRDLLASLRGRHPALFDRWLGFPGPLTDDLLVAVKRMNGFRFKRHRHYNLSGERLDAIERILQNRVSAILQYGKDADGYLRFADGRVGVNSRTEENNVGVNTADFDQQDLQILWNVKADPRMTARELSSVLGVEPRTIERRIRALREKGVLSRVGPDKTGHWEVLI